MTKRAAIEIDGDVHEALLGQAAEGDIALLGSLPIGAGADAPVPEWIHLLPVGPDLPTFDGRSFKMTDPAAVVAGSTAALGERPLPVDENHATDRLGDQGYSAPAVGWLEQFDARPDGIWAKVDWNKSGRALLEDRAYRGVSAVIRFDPKTREVLAITRASLINKPNMKGLQALNGESGMDLLAKLTKALKLKDGTSEDAVVAAATKLAGDFEALNGQLTSVTTAAGLAAGATAEALLGAVETLAKRPVSADAVNEALQGELNAAIVRINELEGSGARTKAEAIVDKAIADKASGVSARRDWWVEQLMGENPSAAEASLAALPRLGPSTTRQDPPGKDKTAAGELTADQLKISAQLGIDPKEFAKTLAAEGQAEATA